ncbi:putative hemoglobin and hemoglobin-haptoglobin-binding protein 2 precursor, partial [Haemophilus influenzae]
MYFTFK